MRHGGRSCCCMNGCGDFLPLEVTITPNPFNSIAPAVTLYLTNPVFNGNTLIYRGVAPNPNFVFFQTFEVTLKTCQPGESDPQWALTGTSWEISNSFQGFRPTVLASVSGSAPAGDTCCAAITFDATVTNQDTTRQQVQITLTPGDCTLPNDGAHEQCCTAANLPAELDLVFAGEARVYTLTRSIPGTYIGGYVSSTDTYSFTAQVAIAAADCVCAVLLSVFSRFTNCGDTYTFVGAASCGPWTLDLVNLNQFPCSDTGFQFAAVSTTATLTPV